MSAYDVSGIQKPRALATICARTKKYIETMADLGKPVESVAVSNGDYDALLRNVSAGRDKQAPPITELVIGPVRLRRGH